jgi:predicted transcriptional regulator
MFGIKKNKKPKIKKSYNIIFDVRNSSVGSAILEKTDYYNQIIYTNRKYLSSSENNEAKGFMKNSFKKIDEIIEEIHTNEINKEIVKKIDSIYCVFASPWYESKIENFISKQEKKVKFTKDFLDKKLKIEKFKDPKKAAIEDQIISINLNGYDTLDPFGKDFKEARVSFYRGIIDRKVEKYLENKFKDNFKVKEVKFHTHPFTILNVLKNNFHSVNDFCLFDIGGNISEISFYRDGVYKKNISIPKGFNFLINKIIEKDNSTRQNALSKIKLLSEKQLVTDDKENILLDSIIEIFSDLKTEKEKGNEENVSHSIFITTDKDFEKAFYNNFKNSPFYKNILGLEIEPVVRVINSESTKNLVFYKDGVTQDPILSILSNFSTIDF